MFPLIFPGSLTDTYSSLSDLARVGIAPGQLRLAPDGSLFMLCKNNHSAALVIGYPVCEDLANGTGYEVKRMVTACLNLLRGTAMGAIPASGYGWVQVWGPNSATNVETTTDVAIGDSLKGVNAQFYLVQDVATGTEATYARHMVALAAKTANSAANMAVFIKCL